MRKLVMIRKKNVIFKSCLFRKKMSLYLLEKWIIKNSFYLKNKAGLSYPTLKTIDK